MGIKRKLNTRKRLKIEEDGREEDEQEVVKNAKDKERRKNAKK